MAGGKSLGHSCEIWNHEDGIRCPYLFSAQLTLQVEMILLIAT